MPYNNIGVIVCREIGANIAGIAFSDTENPLYILPKSIFVLSEEDRRLMSKQQIIKKEKIPSVGENIEFNANNNNIITVWALTATYREILYGKNGVLQIKTLCVISDEKPARRCWTKLFGFLNVEEKFTDFVIPNVAYTCRVNFYLDLNICENVDSSIVVDLSIFKPHFVTEFAGFTSVELNEAFVREAPWNRNLQLVINQRDVDIDLFDVICKPADFVNMDRCSNVSCLGLDFNDVFCSSKPNEKCKIAFLYSRHLSFGPGCQLLCNMYLCKINKCWIVYNYTRLNIDQFPINYGDDGSLIILVKLKKVFNRPNIYFNEFTSFVSDPLELLANKKLSLVKARKCNKKAASEKSEVFFDVWVKRVDNDVVLENNISFVVVDVLDKLSHFNV